MALHMLALVGSLALAAPAETAAAASPGVAAAQMEALGLLSLKLKHKGKTLKHPGHIMQRDEEVVLVLKNGDHTHEVTIFVQPGEGGFKFEVAYTDNGSLVLSGEKTAKAKQWIKLKSGSGKSWIELQIDPTKKRPDGIDLPEGNDPLDGL